MSALLRIVFVLCALLGALAGCHAPAGEHVVGASPLAGTEDVELTYEIDPKAQPAAPALPAEEVRIVVMRRLSAARIGADVSAIDPSVRVVVDEALAPRVDELVTWTGTLLLFEEADLDMVLPPRDATSRLVPREDGTDHWYEGTRADVMRAIETWPLDRDHRILVEPRWGAEQPTRWRTRVVKTASARELGDGALVGWGDGPALQVRGMEGSRAATLIQHAHDGRGTAVVARGRISLGSPTFSGSSAMQLHFGTGAEAYARAQREKDLLATPRLPPLRRAGAVGLPPNRGLAVACLVVPIVLSLAWLAFVRRFDRAHPEPAWLIALTFLLGALATVPAGLLEAGFASASSWLDPGLVTYGGRPFALPLAIVVFTVVVGLSEEGMKRLAAQFAVRRREFDEPVDGIVYAVVASLGFAAAENAHYFALGRMSAPLVIARCFMSIPAHMFFGAVWGFALGARLVEPKARTWAWLLLAALCHGLFDALLSTEGVAILAVVLNVGLASAFVLFVRRALRHGVVASEMLAIRPEDRALFRVGRPGLFWVSAIALHVLAFGIFLLGAHWQLARHRPSFAFVGGSSAMLALLAVAALGISQTLPLDVAVDAYGVTFAGAARPWRQIRRFVVRADRIELDCETGPILLGPGAPAVIEALANELRKHQADDGAQRQHTLGSRYDPPVGAA